MLDIYSEMQKALLDQGDGSDGELSAEEVNRLIKRAVKEPDAMRQTNMLIDIGEKISRMDFSLEKLMVEDDAPYRQLTRACMKVLQQKRAEQGPDDPLNHTRLVEQADFQAAEAARRQYALLKSEKKKKRRAPRKSFL